MDCSSFLRKKLSNAKTRWKIYKSAKKLKNNESDLSESDCPVFRMHENISFDSERNMSDNSERSEQDQTDPIKICDDFCENTYPFDSKWKSNFDQFSFRSNSAWEIKKRGDNVRRRMLSKEPKLPQTSSTRLAELEEEIKTEMLRVQDFHSLASAYYSQNRTLDSSRASLPDFNGALTYRRHTLYASKTSHRTHSQSNPNLFKNDTFEKKYHDKGSALKPSDKHEVKQLLPALYPSQHTPTDGIFLLAARGLCLLDAALHSNEGSSIRFEEKINFMTREEVLQLAPSVALPHAASKDPKVNCWEEGDASSFMVRGLSYLKDKVKIPSIDAAYTLIGMELLASTAQHKHISSRPNSFVQRYQRAAGKNTPFILVIHFLAPYGNFLCYFIPRTGGQSPYIGERNFDGLLRSFLEGTDEFRDRKLKIVPRVVDGPWVVQQAVGSRPAIIGTKIKQNYYSTDQYFEIEVELMSSKAAGAILNAVKRSTSFCSLELGFILQGDNKSELPERILGCVRFHRIDVLGAVPIGEWESRQTA